MSIASEKLEVDQNTRVQVAAGINEAVLDFRAGKGFAVTTRLSPTVLELIQLAKPEDQTMASFLRECALSEALRRLDESQK